MSMTCSSVFHHNMRRLTAKVELIDSQIEHLHTYNPTPDVRDMIESLESDKDAIVNGIAALTPSVASTPPSGRMMHVIHRILGLN